MDRISAMRNVEEALARFEDGECDLAGLERRVQTILRTYVSEFERPELAVYRVGADAETGVVVVAAGPNEARDRARDLWDDAPRSMTVERVPE
ncbi:hypothetical protein [Haloarchaeobius sp. HRN-SO-5]|uniref:DUF7854 family protein n=1 Tax=Haloarchaeobius sp. HRN-SO-5 TaxID=3446118 RepID=UPI003EC154E3